MQKTNLLILFLISFIFKLLLILLIISIYLPTEWTQQNEELVEISHLCIDDEDCNFQGECWFGHCICDDSYSGQYCDVICEDIDTDTDKICCVDQCNGHGVCNPSPCCTCEFGWFGETCEEYHLCPPLIDPKCENSTDCGDYGYCYYGVCICNPNYHHYYDKGECDLVRIDLTICTIDSDCVGGRCIAHLTGKECFCPLNNTDCSVNW